MNEKLHSKNVHEVGVVTKIFCRKNNEQLELLWDCCLIFKNDE